MKPLRNAILVALAPPDPDSTTCARCSCVIRAGEPVYDGLFVDEQGRRFPHHFCNPCGAALNKSKALHREVAERVELMFSAPRGRA
jgi:hypothetical protein